jgi:hypothetical protein
MKPKPYSKVCLAVLLCFAITISGCNTPAWVTTAIQDLPVLVQIIGEILPLVGVSAATNSQVTSDFTLLENLYAQYKSAASTTVLGQIDTALTVAQSDINQILAAAHVSNAKTQAIIVASLGLVIGTLTAIQADLPALQGQMRTASLHPVPTAAALKASYNAIVNDAGQHELALP